MLAFLIVFYRSRDPDRRKRLGRRRNRHIWRYLKECGR